MYSLPASQTIMQMHEHMSAHENMHTTPKEGMNMKMPNMAHEGHEVAAPYPISGLNHKM